MDQSMFCVKDVAVYARVNDETYDLSGNATFEDDVFHETDHDLYRCAKRFQSFRSDCEFRIYKDGHLSICVSFENCGSAILRLGNVEFAIGKGGGELRWETPDPLQILWTTGTCCNSAYPVISCDQPENRCVSRHFSLIYDRCEKTGLMVGFLTFDRLMTEIRIKTKGPSVFVTAVCDFNQYELKPGEVIESETLTFEAGLDYHPLLVRWAERVKNHYHPKFSSQPAIGWIGGWNHRNAFIGEITYEKIVKENVELIQKEFSDYPIKYIWVSIGNLDKDLPGNWLTENKKRFPSGLSSLSAYLQSKGFNLGLWTAPFWIPDKYTDLHEIYWDSLLRNKGEPVHIKGIWRIGETGDDPFKRAGFYSLDPTHPKAEAFLRNVFTYYKESGVRYFMLDFLNAGEGPMSDQFKYDEYYDKSLINGPQAYRKAMQTIRESSSDDTYMVASTGPTLINIGTIDATRTGPDFGEGREPSPKYPSYYPAPYKTDAWSQFRLAINYYAASYHMDKRLFHIDAFNVLNIDPPASISEIQTVVSLFAMSAGPVMLGGDLAQSDPFRLQLLKKCLPQAKTGAIPLDLFEPLSEQGSCLFYQEHVTEWDQWVVLYVINTGSEVLHPLVSLESLGFEENEEIGVYDFWDQKYLGRKKGHLSVGVLPYSTKVYRLFRHKSHPTIISTDMHVSQGAVDLAKVEWDEENLVLKGCATRGKNETGSVTVSLPSGYLPKTYMNYHVAKSEYHDETVIYKQIHFNSAMEPFQIHFKKEEEKYRDTESGRM